MFDVSDCDSCEGGTTVARRLTLKLLQNQNKFGTNDKDVADNMIFRWKFTCFGLNNSLTQQTSWMIHFFYPRL